jgi:RNA recognition motif-containing protein
MFLEVRLVEGDSDSESDAQGKCNSQGCDSSTASWASSVDDDSDFESRVENDDEDCESVEISDDETEGESKPSPPGTFYSTRLPAQSVTKQPRMCPEAIPCTDAKFLTTLAVRNLPANCTGFSLAQVMDSLGFQGQFDFIYAPVDFHDGQSLRYASVNMVSNECALRALSKLSGMILQGQSEPIEVSWSLPLQGLEVHIRRYQNSPVMHTAVPDAYKPMWFHSGIRQAFPAPTKHIKKPRLRTNFVAP